MGDDLRDKLLDDLYRVLLRPKGLRLKLLKLIYPEICKLGDSLREYFWADKCPRCGTTDVEKGSLDSNRYCNRCGAGIN